MNVENVIMIQCFTISSSVTTNSIQLYECWIKTSWMLCEWCMYVSLDV
jgi:hypothetical protein